MNSKLIETDRLVDLAKNRNKNRNKIRKKKKKTFRNAGLVIWDLLWETKKPFLGLIRL